MARKVSVRVIANRKALSDLRGAAVDGMADLGAAILERAAPNVPDDPTTTERIVGDWGVWADGRKVAGTATKPHHEDVKQGITLLVGYPFPMRFHEEGTVHEPARPVLTPVAMEDLPQAPAYIAEKARVIP